MAESVAADLRKRILRSEETNVPLPRQDDLLRQYGVSGPSLREALRILEAEGLITVRRGKFGGAFVHKPSWSQSAYSLALSMQGQGITISDLGESLLVMEPMCAGACAERIDRDKDLLPALRENLEETEACIGDGARYSRAARAFHDLLVTGVENLTTRLLVRSMVAIWSVQEELWADTVSSAAQYPGVEHQRESLNTHATMLKLVEAGDVDAVTKLAAAHLRATQRIVLERFGGEVVDASSLAAVQAFKSL
ncbi:FadR/GntR family transcriptional regulator [Microbacterium sp.]|uniref:FadR/GntR family transcriptional regulator n=1 Tax=Microbacterium sp. TaxID=51671 RepID=UPI0037C7B589